MVDGYALFGEMIMEKVVLDLEISRGLGVGACFDGDRQRPWCWSVLVMEISRGLGVGACL